MTSKEKKQCRHCGGFSTKKVGLSKNKTKQLYYCRHCKKQFSDPTIKIPNGRECVLCYGRNTRIAGSKNKERVYYCKDCHHYFCENRKVRFNKKGEKYCDECQCFLPQNMFYMFQGKPIGRRCKQCTPHNVKYEYNRNFKQYGLTKDEFLQMLIGQNNLCAICGYEFKDEKRKGPQIDHDHNTGIVRGLLCRNCNYLLGRVHDNVEILANAISYLKNK